MPRPASEDVHFRVLRVLERNPELTQRDIARELKISLGAVNYCVGALIEKGQIKVRNFRSSDNKLRYAYILTPRGVSEKARLTGAFIKRKMAEYEALKAEIDALAQEQARWGAATEDGGEG